MQVLVKFSHRKDCKVAHAIALRFVAQIPQFRVWVLVQFFGV
jgi:hypothetical protein